MHYFIKINKKNTNISLYKSSSLFTMLLLSSCLCPVYTPAEDMQGYMSHAPLNYLFQSGVCIEDRVVSSGLSTRYWNDER